MKSILKNVGLLALGAVLCLAIQTAARLHYVYRMTQSVLPSPRHSGMSEADVRMWTQVRTAIEGCDVKRVNKLLRVDPGELVLVVRTCPLFPDGCNPIAEISVSNAANRLLTVFDPRVQRLTEPSYQHQNCMQDDYSVDCSISTATRWCRVLKPGQTLALPPTILTVDGSGPHQVNFALTCQLYESISDHSSRSTCPVVARTVTRFELGTPVQDSAHAEPSGLHIRQTN